MVRGGGRAVNLPGRPLSRRSILLQVGERRRGEVMFRIRRIYDDTLPVNRQIIADVQGILRDQFPLIGSDDVAKLPELLRNPLKYRLRSILFVAEGSHRRVKGFALVMHAPDLHFSYLDYISSEKGLVGRGVGGALYERVRAEVEALGAIGLFFECLPDDPALCRDPETLKQNAARLRFYERYGARPIAGTAYETPLTPGGDNPPYLVYDALGKNRPLHRDEARRIVRAILERKYGHLCPAAYIDMVVDSFRDEPVGLRRPRYTGREAPAPVQDRPAADERIVLVVNDRHVIHHVRERGYVESPVRLRVILRELEKLPLFERIEHRHFGERHLLAVHDHAYVAYFKRVCEQLAPDKSVYPYVFPIRNGARPPKELAVRAGYYCIDTFTPLNGNAFQAARAAVDCALTGAERLLEGDRLAYALVRPPGHHAERRSFGGFCYFNSNATAANFLAAHGRVAVLDIDYHHGNGQQDIFFARPDVLTVSIHGSPHFAYPYFSGFEEETGSGPGEGYNANLPLPEHVDGEAYRHALRKALRRVERHEPAFLVVALGLDTAKGDPTGSWSLRAEDFRANGRLIGALGLPTLVVQEGGYDTHVLGINARHFFRGLWEGAFGRGGEQVRSR
jgi:acetoin utilization deacetylase AcuC-like enzyme/GNAT superfamily N-acetyltransferase